MAPWRLGRIDRGQRSRRLAAAHRRRRRRVRLCVRRRSLPSADGALVEFEYADWGGSGADGLTFFLFDGSTGEGEFHAGQRALGGEISYTYAWQRCEADGTGCANIPGAQAPTYKTTNADVGHTIRFTQTATNDAGSATADSAVYRLPTAEITAAPSGFLPTREAVLAFRTSTNEAQLECSLDGAAWSACASPLSYQDLADGEHSFSVRATHGGLGDPRPASVQWTVESTPPPAPTIVSATSSPTPPADAVFQFGDLMASDALECRLDRGGWRPCTALTEFAGLAEGGHELQVRQVNRAGVASSVTGYTWKVEAAALPPSTVVEVSALESALPSGGATQLLGAAQAGAHTADAPRHATKHSSQKRRPTPTHKTNTHVRQRAGAGRLREAPRARRARHLQGREPRARTALRE